MRLDLANILKFRLARTTTPSSPAAGFVYFYVKDSDGKPYVKNSSGTETQVGVTGALVLLGEQVASASANLNFTSLITSTYDEYMFEFLNIIPATDNANLHMLMSTNNGSSYASADYEWGGLVWRHNATASEGSTSDSKIALSYAVAGIKNTSTAGMIGSVRLFSPLSTSVHKMIQGQVSQLDATSFVSKSLYGVYKSTTAVDAVRFIMSSGNITSGTIRMYGIVK